MKFETLTDDIWAREIKRARKTPNDMALRIREKLNQLTELKTKSIIPTMSNITNYLPKPSDYSDRFAKALETYEPYLYVVGSAARKTLYGLGTNVKDYDFVISSTGALEDVVHERLEEAFPGKVTLTKWGVVVDAEVFTAKIRVQPIDRFLMGVRFAGDGLAVRVSDGRPLVLPEYMTLPPVVTITKVNETDDQNNKEWLDEHLVTLGNFQEELFKAVNKSLDVPAKS